jgi:hypothetical protein
VSLVLTPPPAGDSGLQPARGTAGRLRILTQAAPPCRDWFVWVWDTLEWAGWEPTCYSVYRSPAEQQYRYDRGDSRARPGQSPHQYGMAMDVVVKPGERSKEQRAVHDWWRNMGFGVLDSGVDPAHCEWPHWRDITRGKG